MRSSNHNDIYGAIVMANPSLSPNHDAPTLPPRYPGIVRAVANHLARREIERQWRAKGLRITRYATIVEQARVYFAEHEEELFALAMERVRTSPWHSMMAEREERERQRKERKRRREASRSVCRSDHAQAGTDIASVLSATSTIF
jgi:hypothetical protein